MDDNSNKSHTEEDEDSNSCGLDVIKMMNITNEDQNKSNEKEYDYWDFVNAINTKKNEEESYHLDLENTNNANTNNMINIKKSKKMNINNINYMKEVCSNQCLKNSNHKNNNPQHYRYYIKSNDLKNCPMIEGRVYPTFRAKDFLCLIYKEHYNEVNIA